MRSLLTALLIALALIGAAQFGDTGQGTAATAPSTGSTRSGPPLGPGPTMPPPPRPAEPEPAELPLQGLALEVVARQLDQPLLAISPLRDQRLFVVEKPGRIKVVENGSVLGRPFLDITAQVDSDGAELGLLGLAFHPQYEWNRRFYVYYTDRNEDTRLVEYRAAAVDRNRADVGTARQVLFLDQPQQFHQGGMMEFGPDGYLWLASGDGGGIGDQYGHGQRPDTLFGTILRIDVDHGDPYAIPPDNPFAAEGPGAPEVWAYGLRNPWRIAIDPVDELIYVADVGQFLWEEVSVVPLSAGGLNFGWPIVEGYACFDADDCDPSGTVPPTIVYSHRQGCAVIGGFVYRGQEIPELYGHYFYGDWCGQWVRSFRIIGGEAVDTTDWTADFGKVGQVLSFGRDSAGELYVTTGNGGLYRIVADRGLPGSTRSA